MQYLCTRKTKGTLAEWLGNGLQNRVRRFESARYLKESLESLTALFVFKSISKTDTLPLQKRQSNEQKTQMGC